MRDIADKISVPARGKRAAGAVGNIKPVLMDVGIANSLICGLDLTEPQLRVAMEHYRHLEELLRISGPHFANARREAAVKHNIVVQRIKESREAAEARRVKAAAYEASLQEIEV